MRETLDIRSVVRTVHRNTIYLVGDEHSFRMSSRSASNFCSQCGVALSPGVSFCSRCRTAAGTAVGSRTRRDRPAFRRRIEYFTVEGWDVKHDYGDRVVMINRGFGSIPLHPLLLVFTSPIGNLFYVWYSISRMPTASNSAETGRRGTRRVAGTRPIGHYEAVSVSSLPRPSASSSWSVSLPFGVPRESPRLGSVWRSYYLSCFPCRSLRDTSPASIRRRRSGKFAPPTRKSFRNRLFHAPFVPGWWARASSEPFVSGGTSQECRYER